LSGSGRKNGAKKEVSLTLEWICAAGLKFKKVWSVFVPTCFSSLIVPENFMQVVKIPIKF
jgi:hypothetical protein